MEETRIKVLMILQCPWHSLFMTTFLYSVMDQSLTLDLIDFVLYKMAENLK